MEYATFPLRNCRQTQSMNGPYSHQGTKAIDYGAIENDYTVYAPFTGKIVYLGTYETGNQIVIQSTEPVQKADGTTGYLSVMTAHDNDLSNLEIGQIIKQNTPYSKMGNAGYATGIHTHLEVVNGKWEGIIENEQGNWMCKNAIEPYKVLHLTENTKIENNEYPYQYLPTLKKYIGTPVVRDNTKNQLEVKVLMLNVREEPSTKSISKGYINTGIYNYIEQKQNDNYTWYQTPYGWIAYNPLWMDIYQKEEIELVQDEEKQTLQEENKILKEQIETLKIEIKNLTEELKKEQKIEDKLQPYLIFTCEKDGRYWLELQAGEKLYLTE